ncbi:(+)-neomenthol dehydrogenase isoform X1 [Cicer arietinum]|uniref:(+)-neomenthol dehydrogenase isoform X1 n=1 Tax=Cicer arietinum TaxID=3827 RepID=A0A1S2YI55_CICAR|nr:(+)-neomenthol dehydrogenase isoform X1 [Cicer arietinum]
MEPEHYFPSAALCSTRWWSKETVAVVTGGNKGIGFAVVKRLAEVGVNVVLTARDKQKGEGALKRLREQLGVAASQIHFLLLDVSDPNSIKTFASSFKAKFGPTLDILVNNAGVSFNELDENSVGHAECVIKTNFYGPKFVIEALLPLFRSSSSSVTRILNVSSRLGSLNKMRNEEMKKCLENEELKEEEIEEMVKKFLRDVKNGTWKSEGWPSYWTDYAVSKLALNAYSKVLAKNNNNYKLGSNNLKMSVNCFCPGFTKTSMTKGKGTHTADQAASLAATLVLLPSHHLPTGKFFLLRNTNNLANSKL